MELKWSDGSALTADDFVYSWNRAADPATASDYQYIFDIIDGYDELTNGDEDAKLNVTASEDGKKLTVVLKVDVPYFIELAAFPTYSQLNNQQLKQILKVGRLHQVHIFVMDLM